jgi:hypothetical protein
MWTEANKNGKARILTVWGGPGSGKTTLAAKLAMESEARKINTVLLLCDNVTPELPALLPYENDLNHSLGALLDSALLDSTTSSVDDSLSLKDSLSYTVCLGYAPGENVLSYPAPTALQAQAALSLISDNCDVIIVSAPTDFLRSPVAMVSAEESDLSVCVISPNIKIVSYLSSYCDLFPSRKKRITVLNHSSEMDAQAWLVDTDVDLELSFSHELNLQQREGKLFDAATAGLAADKAYQAYRRGVAHIYDIFEKTGEAEEKEEAVHE